MKYCRVLTNCALYDRCCATCEHNDECEVKCVRWIFVDTPCPDEKND